MLIVTNFVLKWTFVWKLYRISQEMDAANERIFLLHVDGTEWYTTVQ
jgi:hypothetical protein